MFNGMDNRSIQPVRPLSQANMRPATQVNMRPATQVNMQPQMRANVARRGNLALNLPIAWRLTLGFVLAGLIAAASAGFVGALRAQALTDQSSFYQSLLQNNTNLSTGDSFLQLMNTKTHEILDVLASPAPSNETLTTDEQDLPRLASYYDGVINDYAANDLLSKHANQLATLQLAGDTNSATKQAALVSSALRTWRAYRDAQQQMLAGVTANDLTAAQSTERLAAEPTNADAQSALRALIQFNNGLSNAVRLAASAQERNFTIDALVAALFAFAAVALVGWVISETIVRRLHSLQVVTQAIEHGRLDTRVRVVGRDEISDVSASVNGMLDTIVGLLEETRRQRDALSNAAERLFTDMRVASGGDLRVNAIVSSDPIGLLGNAFNLTIGRFKRFVSRSRLATDQINGIARKQVERADVFIGAVRRSTSSPGSVSDLLAGQASSLPSWPMGLPGDYEAPGLTGMGPTPVAPQLSVSLERVRTLTDDLGGDAWVGRARRSLELAEQAYLSLVRLTQLLQRLPRVQVEASGVSDEITQEVRTLDSILHEVGREAYTMNQTAPESLSALREAVATVERSASSGPFNGGPANALLRKAPASDSQVYEFVRVATDFAQETSALARQLLVVAQEMQVSVTPFQLDGSGDMMNEYGGEMAYQPYPPIFPGQPTGYNQPSGYDQAPGYNHPSGFNGYGRPSPSRGNGW
ncbi:MAG TPA: HAMP domain-containing protein [Ktedonobacterales bacterium]